MSTNDRNGWHYLRPLRRGSYPRRIIIFDTETYRQEADQKPGETSCRFRLACISVWIKSKVGYRCVRRYLVEEIGNFWETIAGETSKRNTTWLIAHNVGFDLTVTHFWDLLERGIFDISKTTSEPVTYDATTGDQHVTDEGFAVLTDPPVIVNGWLRENHIVIVDWFNYHRQSLAEIGESIGVPKMGMPAEDASGTEWEKYCRNDMDILEKSVISTMETWEKDIDAPWGYTGPALAMNAFRRHYLQERQVLVHRDSRALELERLAYYGGEIVTGYRGVIQDDGGAEDEYGNVNEWGESDRSGRVYVLDTNSLYPHVMSTEYLPCRLHGFVKPADLFSKYGGWPSVQYCAMVRIKSASNTYPVRVDKTTLMPLLDEGYNLDGTFSRAVGRVVYAMGNYWTCLCGRELHHALTQGDVEDVRFVTEYHAEPFLKEFADEFYRRRVEQNEKGNRAGSKLYKLILNSLHGKFGQTTGGWTESEDTCPPLLWGQWIEVDLPSRHVRTRRSLGGRVQELEPKREHASSCPVISAAIAAAGRWTMGCRRHLLAGVPIYYGDTDSIHTNQEGYSRLQDANLVSDTELGKMRLVKVGIFARYIGQKYYKVNAEWTHAGFSKSAREVDLDCFSFAQFSGVNDIIRQNPPGDVQVTEVQRRIKSIPLSGRLLRDGTVVPHVVRDY